MRVVSSSSLLFTSLVASSVSLPSLAAPVRARRDSIYERQEMGSPLPAAFESSASTSNLAGLVAPPTTPAFRVRDNHVLGGALGDFKHEFEGLINALEISASPAPVPTRSKKPFPSSLSQLHQSTTLAATGMTSSSSTSASASSNILARGDSFFEGLIGALDVTSSSTASGTSASASASSTPSLPPQPTNTPAMLARSLGARNTIDGMLEGLGHYNIMSMTAASASASTTPSLDAREADDILGELVGALGVLGSHAHSESATSSQTTSSPSLPMTSPTLGTRDGVLDGLIGALDVSTTMTTKLFGLGITSGTSSSTSATGAPTQTMA